jgi:hypothetical protein
MIESGIKTILLFTSFMVSAVSIFFSLLIVTDPDNRRAVIGFSIGNIVYSSISFLILIWMFVDKLRKEDSITTLHSQSNFLPVS